MCEKNIAPCRFTAEEVEKGAEASFILMKSYGVTADEAATAIQKLVSLLPPPGHAEIQMILNNPSLSLFQKWRLIRLINREFRNILTSPEYRN